MNIVTSTQRSLLFLIYNPGALPLRRNTETPEGLTWPQNKGWLSSMVDTGADMADEAGVTSR